MLKAGVFLDVENLSRNGGWGMRYNVILDLARAQEAMVLRANAYLASDPTREEQEPDFRKRSEEFRNAIRRNGFHLVLKEVRRYRDDDGNVFLKANSDLDLAVDALVQSQKLDYVLLGSGDGDFVRLVRALQNRGKRVDLLSFANTSYELQREVDYYLSGFLIPGLVPSNQAEEDRRRGILYSVNEDRGYGFISVRNGLGVNEVRHDVFCHINDFRHPIDDRNFANLKTHETILEFDLITQEDGKLKAENVETFNWQDR